MATSPIVSSEFGQRLRQWRRTRGLSQLELAQRAETTPRHLSFLETGRSRPGREIVLRLADTLDVPKRERNVLLRAAGLRAVYPEHELDAPILQPYRRAMQMILDGHEPNPGSVIDAPGKVLATNAAYRRLLPDADRLSPEESIDRFYAEFGPARVLNWPEVAWSEVDRRRRDASRLGIEALHHLADRAEAHLADVPRVEAASESEPSPIVTARWRQGDEVLSTFSAAMRFDAARDITMSELRVELVFPADPKTAAYFRSRATAASEPPLEREPPERGFHVR